MMDMSSVVTEKLDRGPLAGGVGLFAPRSQRLLPGSQWGRWVYLLLQPSREPTPRSPHLPSQTLGQEWQPFPVD